MSAGTINLRTKNYFLRVAVEAWERGVFVYILQPTFPAGSVSKESACIAGDPGSIPELGRSPGEGNGNPLQYSCLKIPWREELVGYTPRGSKESDHRVAKSWTRLSDFTFTTCGQTRLLRKNH